MAEATNPYGDGRAAGRIVAALEYLHAGGAAPAPFGSSLDRRAVLAATGMVDGDIADLPCSLPESLPVREAS